MIRQKSHFSNGVLFIKPINFAQKVCALRARDRRYAFYALSGGKQTSKEIRQQSDLQDGVGETITQRFKDGKEVSESRTNPMDEYGYGEPERREEKRSFPNMDLNFPNLFEKWGI